MGSEKALSDELAGSISAGSLKVFVGEIVLRATDYALTVALARYLKPDLYGVYATGFMLSSILLTLSNLGLFSGITRHVSKHVGSGNVDRIVPVFTFASLLPLSLSFAAFVVVSANAQVIADNLFDGGHLSVIFLFLLLVPFRALYNASTSLLTGFNNMSLKVGVDVTRNVLQVGVIVYLIHLNVSLRSLVLGTLCVMAVSSLLALGLGVRQLNEEGIPFHVSLDATTATGLLSYSLPLVFARISNLGMQWGDIFLLSYFSPSRSVGIYRTAFSLSEGLSIFLIVFAVPFFPLASRLYTDSDHSQLEQLFQMVTRWIYTLSIPMFVFTALFAGPIVLAFFGQEYRSAASPLRILVGGTFVSVLTGNAVQLLKSADKTRYYFYISVSTMALNLVLNASLVPVFHMQGAAVATAISVATLNLLALSMVYRTLGVRGYQSSSNYLRSTVLSLALAAPLVLSGWVTAENVVPVAIGYYVIYALVLPFSGATEDTEIRLVRTFIDRCT